MLPLLLTGVFVGMFAGFRTNVIGLAALSVVAVGITLLGGVAVSNSSAGILLSMLAVMGGLQVGYVAAVVVRAWMAPKCRRQHEQAAQHREAEKFEASRRR